MHAFKPSKPLLQLHDFPASVQPHAVREHFAGTGAAGAPLIYGWIVFSQGGPNGGVAYDDDAKKWLKKHGFKHSGRRWYLRDDIACGEEAFARGTQAA
jgi:hypothetical protein